MSKAEKPWYKSGLKFECQGCGGCCTGEPGYVWVNPDDFKFIADFLKISERDFMDKYVRQVFGSSYSLKEYTNGDCCFFDSKTGHCRIYPVRPVQCRTWPFWNSCLENESAWKETARRCPGCNQGQLHKLGEIEQRRSLFDV